MLAAAIDAAGQTVEEVPTRPGVVQRVLLLPAAQPTASVILFPGGHGGLGLSASGAMRWGAGNFLVRTRQLFWADGLTVAVLDAPSDRQEPPYLGGFRQTAEHVTDVKAVIAHLRRRAAVPVWLVGTSRGTQSAAFVATMLASRDGGPDGLVLTSTILSDAPGSRPVPDMALDRIAIPTLVVHHRHDGCRHCQYDDVPRLMDRLVAAPQKELLTFDGGATRGDPCEARAYHGFNGLEQDVVRAIAAWIRAPRPVRSEPPVAPGAR